MALVTISYPFVGFTQHNSAKWVIEPIKKVPGSCFLNFPDFNAKNMKINDNGEFNLGVKFFYVVWFWEEKC